MALRATRIHEDSGPLARAEPPGSASGSGTGASRADQGVRPTTARGTAGRSRARLRLPAAALCRSER
jgi:hypothetical protein